MYEEIFTLIPDLGCSSFLWISSLNSFDRLTLVKIMVIYWIILIKIAICLLSWNNLDSTTFQLHLVRIIYSSPEKDLSILNIFFFFYPFISPLSFAHHHNYPITKFARIDCMNPICLAKITKKTLCFCNEVSQN